MHIAKSRGKGSQNCHNPIASRAQVNFFVRVNRRFLAIVVLILGVLLGLYFLSGTGGTSVLLANASDVADRPQDFLDRELRVRGFVKPGTILRMGDKAEFVVELDGKNLPVLYNGNSQLPDTFGDAAPVRVDGHLEDGKLMAHKVEAKCASKYDVPHAGEPGYGTSEHLDALQAAEKDG